ILQLFLFDFVENVHLGLLLVIINVSGAFRLWRLREYTLFLCAWQPKFVQMAHFFYFFIA
ncbi:MAG: hypothetical protein IKC90_04440, partial [Akkermansia sp.]|nr:hypothetical protein [Akkermansia sp.]